jgi:hypothetical protein
VAVSGTLQGGGELIVYMLPPGSECPNALQFEGAETFAGTEMSAGTKVLPNASIVGRTPVGESFSATYSVIPPGIGKFMLCGYAFRLPSFYPTTVTGHEVLEVLAPPEHLTTLSVSARIRRGKTASMPGKTELLVHVNPEAEVIVSVTHRGHTTRNPVDPDGPSSGKPLTLGVLWSCNKPGGLYAWTITASDAYGGRLSRSGSFRAPLSPSRCRALRIADARRSAERRRQEAQRREENKRKEESPTQQAAKAVEHTLEEHYGISISTANIECQRLTTIRFKCYYEHGLTNADVQNGYTNGESGVAYVTFFSYGTDVVVIQNPHA